MTHLKLLFPALLTALILLSVTPAHAHWGARNKAAAEAGAVLFRDRGCARCHGANGIGGKKGPALTDLRRNKQWKADRLRAQILNGGQKMPPFGEALSDPEVAQLIAYLRAKHRPVAPNAPRQ
jgi:mono/diheme cytochrome c family protein